jgi:hypothetical protein
MNTRTKTTARLGVLLAAAAPPSPGVHPRRLRPRRLLRRTASP